MKRILYFLIPALLLASLIGWRLMTSKKAKVAQDQAAAARKNAPPNVNAAPATVRDIVHTFEGVGSAEAPYNVRISSKVTGLLKTLALREGDPVHSGEEVARIDPSQMQAQVQAQQGTVAEAQQRLAQAALTTNQTSVQITSGIRQQQAAVSSSQANANQVEQNYAAQVASSQSAVTDAQGRVDNADAAISNAQAGIRSAQANLDNATVRYNRTYELYKQGFTAAQDVDDAAQWWMCRRAPSTSRRDN